MLKNLPLKLTALGLAFLLWFHVVTDKSYDYRAELSFRTAPLPMGWVLTDPLPETIRLQVHGTGKDIMRLLWNKGSAELVVEPGMQEHITVTPANLVMSLDAEVTVQRVIEPTQVTVHVDTLLRQPKRVRFQGEYATSPGLSLVRPPVLVPDQVLLSGPRSRVEAVSAINTVPVDLRLLTESVSRDVALELGQAYNVRAEPSKVRLELEVAPTVRKEIAGVPIQVPQGWKADPPQVTLGVAGAEERLADLGIEFYRAAVTLPAQIRAESLYTVHATVPPLVEILSIQPDLIRIYRP